MNTQTTTVYTRKFNKLTQQKKKARAWLEEKGYPHTRPLCAHLNGLPGNVVAVLNSAHSASSGETAVFVYLDKVVQATVSTPYNCNSWRRIQVHGYDTEEQLLEILDQYVEAPSASCWS